MTFSGWLLLFNERVKRIFLKIYFYDFIRTNLSDSIWEVTEADQILVLILTLRKYRKWMWAIYFWINICLIRAQRTFINCRFTIYFIWRNFLCHEFAQILAKKYAYLKAVQNFFLKILEKFWKFQRSLRIPE